MITCDVVSPQKDLFEKDGELEVLPGDDVDLEAMEQQQPYM